MRSFSRRRLTGLAAGFAAMLIVPVRAHDGHGATEATPGATPSALGNTGTGAVYLTIRNNGDSPDRLIAAVTDAAQVVEIHSMSTDGGVMKMQELVDGLEIPPGESVTLDPDNLHLMLVDLNCDLAPNSSFEVVLTFEIAGEVTVTAVVTTSVPEDESAVTTGNLEISKVWARPAPRLTPSATPAG
jgi:hypothetical protein